jgi:GH25 family lysozyme M1 (1,4-beta-N-acetylmuramidase)
MTLLALLGCHHDAFSDIRHPGHPEDTDVTVADDTDLPADTDVPLDTDTTYTTTGDPPYGVDVSRWQGTIDWGQVAGDAIGFAYVKATEGTYYLSPTFADQYNGAYDAGLTRGAYHFAIPSDSDGATQADYFVDNGGGWSNDGHTLPGVLDIEYNPYPSEGDTCYDMNPSELTAWTDDFLTEYQALTGRDAVIYSTANWWDNCVGSPDFGGTNPLWVAHYGVDSPNLPGGWPTWTIWQYTSQGGVAGIAGDVDMNVFNGPPSRLHALAVGP